MRNEKLTNHQRSILIEAFGENFESSPRYREWYKETEAAKRQSAAIADLASGLRERMSEPRPFRGY